MIGLPNWLNKFRKQTSGGGGGGGGSGTFTLIDHKIAFNTASGTATTAAIDTTGASLVTIWSGSLVALTPTDVKGNPLTGLTAQTNGGYVGRFFYCINPASVGSGHTWSAQGTNAYPMIAVAAWAYSSGTPVLDNENGANSATGSSIQTGSGSSSGGTPLVLAGICLKDTGDTFSIDSSFSITDQSRNGGTNIGIAMAYLLQSGGGAGVNPTWSLVGGAEANLCAAIVAFK
jgi:hypothetical protein